MLELVPQSRPDQADLQQSRESQRRFRLAKLLQDTDEILRHAQQGEWEIVEKMERIRQVELALCFEESDHSDSPVIIEALAALLQMNRQITSLVIDAREKLMSEQQVREKQKAVAREYEKGY